MPTGQCTEAGHSFVLLQDFIKAYLKFRMEFSVWFSYYCSNLNFTTNHKSGLVGK